MNERMKTAYVTSLPTFTACLNTSRHDTKATAVNATSDVIRNYVISKQVRSAGASGNFQHESSFRRVFFGFFNDLQLFLPYNMLFSLASDAVDSALAFERKYFNRHCVVSAIVFF